MVAAEKEAEKDPNITIFNQTFITTTTYLQSTSVKHHHHSNIHNHLQSQPSNHHNLHNHLQSNITTVPESKTQTTKLKKKNLKKINKHNRSRERKRQKTKHKHITTFIFHSYPLQTTTVFNQQSTKPTQSFSSNQFHQKSKYSTKN